MLANVIVTFWSALLAEPWWVQWLVITALSLFAALVLMMLSGNIYVLPVTIMIFMIVPVFLKGQWRPDMATLGLIIIGAFFMCYVGGAVMVGWMRNRKSHNSSRQRNAVVH